MNRHPNKIIIKTGFIATLAFPMLASFGCTGQLKNSFRLAQQEQTFNAQLDINTKIDLLWVVDNSSSMNVNQEKLRQGFAGFAAKYMQPTWDIQVAVITTDTYLANNAFQGYINSTISGTTGWASTYIQGRKGTFVNPTYNSSLLNLTTGIFDSGVTNKDLVPAWGLNYAKLQAGIHDGPITTLCFEGSPFFYYGAAGCSKRDDQNTYTDTGSKCLSPNASAGETADNMCINTTENDRVRSGKAIIQTMPTTTLTGAALTAWTAQIVKDFKINMSTGASGIGSERGLGSVLQLLSDNEATGSTTKFFRQGSLRGIIFVTDEDDQTFTIASGATNVNPFDNYMCDQASLLSMNTASAVTGVNGYCCTGANNCRFGANGTSCPAKVIDGVTHTISLCPNPSNLMAVSTIKSQLDTFFNNIDGSTTPNYFITTITPLTDSTITTLQALRDTDDSTAGITLRTKGTDRGDRYIALGTLVGGASQALDLGASDYAPLLDSIGQAIIQKKSTFTLSRAPTAVEDMIITLTHADGTSAVIDSSKYTISGKSVVITDQNLVLSFAATDHLTVNYQPRSMN